MKQNILTLHYTRKPEASQHMPQSQYLRFNLVDNIVVDAWVRVIRKKLSNPKCVGTISHGSFPMYDDPITLHAELLTYIKIAQEIAPELYCPDSPRSLTQKNLNALHQTFHEVEETRNEEIRNSLRLKTAFSKINHLVHKLKRILSNNIDKSYIVYNYGTPGIYSDRTVAEPISPAHREYFQQQYHKMFKPVCITLGYATIGKHLGHAAHDSDIAVVKDKMVRPQLYIDSEFIFNNDVRNYISSKLEIEQENEKRFQIKKDFIKNNQLEEYIDANKIEHRNTTQPVLGFITDEYDSWKNIDYYSLFINYDFYRPSFNF